MKKIICGILVFITILYIIFSPFREMVNFINPISKFIAEIVAINYFQTEYVEDIKIYSCFKFLDPCGFSIDCSLEDNENISFNILMDYNFKVMYNDYEHNLFDFKVKNEFSELVKKAFGDKTFVNCNYKWKNVDNNAAIKGDINDIDLKNFDPNITNISLVIGVPEYNKSISNIDINGLYELVKKFKDSFTNKNNEIVINLMVSELGKSEKIVISVENINNIQDLNSFLSKIAYKTEDGLYYYNTGDGSKLLKKSPF